MRQFTTPEQTAKLIGLGFEKPRNERWVLDVANESTPSIQNIVKRQDYSIGELIEMLPKSLKNPYNPPLAIECNEKWRVYYGVQEDYSWEWSIWYEVDETELIDALYNMIVKLKGEGVI